MAISATVVAATCALFWPRDDKPEIPAPASPAPVHAAAAKPEPKPEVAKTESKTEQPLALDLTSAIRENRIRVELRGNGKDKLAFVAHNNGAQPIRLHLAAGQLFASDKSTVALARSRDIQVEPNARKNEDLPTVATTAAAPIGDATFNLSATKLPRLDAFLAYVDEHPEIPLAAIQTATLALTENLPVSAFAKFTTPDGGAKSQLDTSAFKADTSDIIAALIALRDSGLDQKLALTIDPQLKIEAMIDPLAHALALRYYSIGDEWAYWKNELLTGNLATRHYALYGIARFYPDVAVQMLPTWARAAHTSTIFRTSAIQALAETQRPEALTALRQLETELGAATDLGKTAHIAANYLDTQFTKSPVTKISIAFRASKPLPEQKPAIAATN